jgi:hypothetical protein
MGLGAATSERLAAAGADLVDRAGRLDVLLAARLGARMADTELVLDGGCLAA